MSYPILTCYSGGAAAAAGGVVLGVGDADNPHYQLQLQILYQQQQFNLQNNQINQSENDAAASSKNKKVQKQS